MGLLLSFYPLWTDPAKRVNAQCIRFSRCVSLCRFRPMFVKIKLLFDAAGILMILPISSSHKEIASLKYKIFQNKDRMSMRIIVNDKIYLLPSYKKRIDIYLILLQPPSPTWVVVVKLFYSRILSQDLIVIY